MPSFVLPKCFFSAKKPLEKKLQKVFFIGYSLFNIQINLPTTKEDLALMFGIEMKSKARILVCSLSYFLLPSLLLLSYFLLTRPLGQVSLAVAMFVCY